MTAYKSGDVVLVYFPFTDTSATKKRPALVVSPPEFSKVYGDIVIIAITSVPQPVKNTKIENWKEAGLLMESWLKPIIGTISANRVR